VKEEWMADETDQEIPVSWMAMPYRVPVLDRNGKRIGTAESLEGDVNKDIFHRITRITTRAVHTDLADGELESLPPYTEERVFRLDWGGLFRKHPEWKQEPPL
jgi:hypothetical protein